MQPDYYPGVRGRSVTALFAALAEKDAVALVAENGEHAR
jgi:hypothetical protein